MPTYFFGMLQGVSNAQGDLRMGAQPISGDANNASWLVVNSLVGDTGAVSLQSMSLTPGVGGLCKGDGRGRKGGEDFRLTPHPRASLQPMPDATFYSGTSTGTCTYASPMGDVGLSTGASLAAASWVMDPQPTCPLAVSVAARYQRR